VSTFRQLAVGVKTHWIRRAIHADWGRYALLAVSVPVAAFLALDTRAKPADLVEFAAELGETQSAEVRRWLEWRHVPFELKDGGQTVLVPAAQCAELTIELASILAEGGAEVLSATPSLVNPVVVPSALRDAVGLGETEGEPAWAQEQGTRERLLQQYGLAE
jgi:hypothetical protein